MTDERLEYEMAIKDSMSGPAHREVEALGALERAALGAAERLDHLAHANENAGHEAHKHAGFAEELQHQLLGHITVATLAAGAIEKLAQGFAELGEKLLDFGIEGVTAALQAAEFRENMTQAFEVVSGTAEEAENTYRSIEGMAVAQHIGIQRALNSARELGLAGLKNEQTISDVVAAQGELQRVGLEAGAEKLQRIILTSEAMGHLVLPKKIGGMGFNLDDLNERLGLPKGTDLKKIKVDTEKGIEAIASLISHGNVGKLAASKFDLHDVETDWANVWQKLREDVHAGPLTSALRDFVSIFDNGTASGKVFHDEIVKDVNGIVEVAGKVVEDIEILSLRLVLGFQNGTHAAKPLIEQMYKLGLEAPNIEKIGVAVERIAALFVYMAYGEALSIGYLLQFAQGLLKFEQEAEQFITFGIHLARDFVAGIVDALHGGQPSMHQAGWALLHSAIEGGKLAALIRSPSAVTYEMGLNLTEGLARGVERGSGSSDAAMSEAMTVPAPGAAPMGGSRSITFEAGSFHFEYHGSGGMDREEFRSLAEEVVTDAIERVNLELGG